jgi:hypothetical protein
MAAFSAVRAILEVRLSLLFALGRPAVRRAQCDRHRGRADAGGVVRDVVAPHRIQDARQAMRERDQRDPLATPRRDLQAPRAQRGGLGGFDRRSCHAASTDSHRRHPFPAFVMCPN